MKVTAESSIGFPPSPGFPESSAAKELSGLDDVLSIYFLVVTGNLSDEHWLHWLGFCVAFCWVCGFVSLLLFACFLASVVCTAVRRALCQRRPRHRVGCSGQAVPCLVLRRCQQAVLVYMGFC